MSMPDNGNNISLTNINAWQSKLQDNTALPSGGCSLQIGIR